MHNDNAFHHITVLQAAAVDLLELEAGDTAVDCTGGGGGHTELLLQAVGDDGRVLVLDRDPMAIEHLRIRFKTQLQRGTIEIIHTHFGDIAAVLAARSLEGKVAGIVADLGVSSPQLDMAARGFSFAKDGPLDMRMDTSCGTTAADLVNSASAEELMKIFRDYGEEPKAKFVAQAIVRERSIKAIATTAELARLVEKAIHYSTKSKKHPATKVFQALRIAVNAELDDLRVMLNDGFAGLKSSGRMGVISFHSLEDRIVKNAFLDLTGRRELSELPRDLPLTNEQVEAKANRRANIIKPFPVVPSDEEMQQNSRARSAHLRVVEKV